MSKLRKTVKAVGAAALIGAAAIGIGETASQFQHRGPMRPFARAVARPYEAVKRTVTNVDAKGFSSKVIRPFGGWALFWRGLVAAVGASAAYKIMTTPTNQPRGSEKWRTRAAVAGGTAGVIYPAPVLTAVGLRKLTQWWYNLPIEKRREHWATMLEYAKRAAAQAARGARWARDKARRRGREDQPSETMGVSEFGEPTDPNADTREP